jgi:probable rRNA maturation factor
MPSNESPVLFRCGRFPLDRRGLRAFAVELRERVAGGRPFQVLIARDAMLQDLNREFLGKDYPADVLSFPCGAPEGLLGEIAISLDRAREQAAEHAHDVSTEIRILMLHGALHLAGMDHETDRGGMRRAETRWRRIFGLPGGLIERVRR